MSKTEPERLQISSDMKQCCKCGLVKPRSEFNRRIKVPRNWDKNASHCRECERKKYREYRKTAKYKQMRKRYRQRPDQLAKRAEQERMRRRKDLRFSLDEAMSSAMRMALKGKKNGYHWEKLVSYTLDDLMRHLEKQFLPGMTWQNWGRGSGQWSIDHIIPKSRFNYEKPIDLDFQRCWALENLRPLWHKDNIAKSDRLEKDFQPYLTLEIA